MRGRYSADNGDDRKGDGMKRFSWYTSNKKYSGNGCYVTTKVHHALTAFAYNECVEHYRPNMKCGHRHNHIRNAHNRMRKCHVCGEPIVTGCEVLGYRFSEFQCRSCRTEECRDYACSVGISFRGCEFETRRRRK
jgi:hypothetical protein